VVVALATVVGSLLADIAYAVLDPRVRYVSS
jgi:ABC-type dipeptide/oligopeptide/nickel transport system permease component